MRLRLLAQMGRVKARERLESGRTARLTTAEFLELAREATGSERQAQELARARAAEIMRAGGTPA